MVPAGRMQDKIGPRSVAAMGGILVGIGFIIASMTTTLIGFIICFGILAAIMAFFLKAPDHIETAEETN